MASSPIANSLRTARERAGLSREALAYRSGLSWAAIAQIESGRRQHVRLPSLAALAEALGVSIDYLAGSGGAHLLQHRAFVYESEDDYLDTVVPYLRAGIKRGEAVLAVTTSPRIRRLRAALGPDAAHVDFHSSAGWYRSPAHALKRYRSYVEQRRHAAAPWTRVVGEPVWSGRTRTEIEAWIRYEAIINLSLASHAATIICPYDGRALSPTILAAAHQTHPELARDTRVEPSPTYVEPEALLL